MSAIGGKADMHIGAAMSAFDPKRTSASISCCSSEDPFQPYQVRLSRYDAALMTPRAGMKRREFLGACRRRGGRVAIRRAGAGTDAPHRLSHRLVRHRRSGNADAQFGFRSGSAGVRLGRREECAGRIPFGRRQGQRTSQACGRLGLISRRRSGQWRPSRERIARRKPHRADCVRTGARSCGRWFRR